MSNPTLKKYILEYVSMSTKIEHFKDNKIILVTAAGIITGFTATHTDDTYNQNCVEYDPFLSCTLEVSNDYIKEFNKDAIKDNDGYIVLKDVELLASSGKVHKMPNLLVFYDQIIAATIGNI